MTTAGIRLALVTGAAFAMLLTGARQGHTQVVDRAAPRLSWDLPAIGSGETRQEEDLVGDNRQPRWTAHDGFAQLDVYVLPKGTGAFVYELRPTRPREAGPTGFATEYQAEFGLPGRIQLGLHAVGEDRNGGGVVGDIHAQAVAIRWALADWGTVWGNPALEVKWKEASRGADAATVALLVAGQLAPGWHWASNGSWRRDMAAIGSDERAWTAGVTYAVKDGVIAFGAESRLASVRLPLETETSRTNLVEFLVGPSLQVRPLRRFHIDVVPLFGATRHSPRARVFLVAGLEF